MSNYIFGYIKGAEKPLSFYADAICARSPLGFHDIAAPPPQGENFGSLPIRSVGLPIPEDGEMTFCIGDHPQTLLSEWLMTEVDFDPDANTGLPCKLHDRLVLIVEQVRIIFEETQCQEVGLWPSVTDDLEGITDVTLSQFLDQLEEDFETRGIPCLLYKILRS